MNPADDLEQVRIEAAVVHRDVESLLEWRVKHERYAEEWVKELHELRLTDRELRTNWKLAMAVGGFAGTALIMLVIAIATVGQ